MAQRDSEKKKSECWEEFRHNNPAYDLPYCHRIYDIAFDRAYALGKQEKDAEGEEMLTVPRSKVQEFYAQCEKVIKEGGYSDYTVESSISRKALLALLFGSMCLPDNVDSSESNVDSSDGSVDSLEHLEPKANSDYTPIPEKTVVSKWDKTEPKPAEPKFKVGQRAMFKGRAVEIIGYSEHYPKIYRVHVFTDNYQTDAKESELEPYTEPKESPRQFYRIIGADEHGRQVITPIPPEVAGPYDISRERTEPGENYIPDLAKMVDNIIKDGLSKERRLNIAAMAMKGILSNPVTAECVMVHVLEISELTLAKKSMMIADALIALVDENCESK